MQHGNRKFILIITIIVSLGLFGFNEAYAAVPQFSTYVADDPDNLDLVYSDGDTVTITFDIATNATGGGLISQAEIDLNFTDSVGPPDFGTTYTGVWSLDSRTLTITVTDVTGGTIAIGVDTIGGRGTTTIADADGGNADLISVGGDTATLSGDFGVVVVATSGGGSSPKGGYVPPTMGVTKYGNVLVEDGFSYNYNPVDVALMTTNYPLVTTKVGEENVAKLKIYSARRIDKLQHIAMGFGLGKGQIFGDSSVVIEWDKLPNGEHVLNVIDPENYLEDVRVVMSERKCRENGNDICLIVEFYHTFRKPLDYNIIGTYIWDNKRSGSNNYYNDGVEIVGDSLDPPAKHQVNHRGELIQITETGKNTSIDANGNTWTLNGYWKMDYVLQGKIDKGITSKWLERDNPKFNTYKQGQELLAEYKLKTSVDGSMIHSKTVGESKTYDIDIIKRSDDIELQNSIAYENERANKWFADNFVVNSQGEFNKYLNIFQKFHEQNKQLLE